MAATTHATLPAWSQRLISELEVIDQRTERLARELEREQINWRPTTGAWSVGQCLEHLMKANEIYLLAISISLEGQRRSQVQEVTLGWFSRLFIRKFIAPSSKGARAPQGPRRSSLPRLLTAPLSTRFFGATTWRDS